MFGTFRFSLALAVVFYHLGVSTWLGPYAVFSFYVLSGFLMTLILEQRYGYCFAGLVDFALSRGLRIFPLYWLTLLMAVATALTVDPKALFEGGRGTMGGWFSELFIVGLRLEPDSRGSLVCQAWSLSVEIIFYLLIALSLSRWWASTMAWVIISWGWVIRMFLQIGADAKWDMFWWQVYAGLAGGAMAFSIGALGCKLCHCVPVMCLVRASWVGLPLWCANFFFPNHLWGGAFYLGFFANVVLSAGAVVCLWAVGEILVVRDGRWRCDAALGALSYPIYLVHNLVIRWVRKVDIEGVAVCVEVAIIVVMVLCVRWAMDKVVGERFEQLRMRFRRKGPEAAV